MQQTTSTHGGRETETISGRQSFDNCGHTTPSERGLWKREQLVFFILLCSAAWAIIIGGALLLLSLG